MLLCGRNKIYQPKPFILLDLSCQGIHKYDGTVCNESSNSQQEADLYESGLRMLFACAI